ncbi:MAG TPA: SurA N-terminal domain-containing protein [Devosia sp.]|nr:SurA N-terminal domain-containing protein [Devosia sp.]
MLKLMRRFASTWLGKLLGGLLLVGMAAFGISNVIVDLGSNTLARVGDDDITTAQFQRAYQQQLNQFAQQTGQMPTNQQAMQFGIPGTVIGQLASDAAINHLALSYGIGVSDAQLAVMVRNDPNFAGNLGTFDRGQFESVLQQAGYTEAEYFDLQSRAARREQIAIGLFDGVTPPKTAENLLNRYRNDTRTVEYFTLNATSVSDIPDPTDADLKAYLTAHQTDFRTKETRTVDVMALTPDLLATLPDYQPSEDAIKAEYDRTKGSLTKTEKRDIQQVVLSDPSKEQFFKPGTNFLDDAKAAGLTPTDFGSLAKTDVTDPSLADAAFGIPSEGGFAIIAGVGGKRVVGVTKIEGGGTISYDEAKPQLVKTLALAKAKAAYADVQDQVESLRAGLKPIKDIAARFKLPLATVALTNDGSELSAYPAIAEADRPKVATAVFAAKEGKLAPTVAISATDNVYFDLTKVDPARDQTLDEVKDKVSAAWTAAKTDDALKAEVAAIIKELDSGKSFQDVASERNQFATISPPITRDGDKTSVLGQQVAAQIFASGANSYGSTVDTDGEYLVYHVTDVTPAQGEGDKNIADFLMNSQRNGLYSEFITGLRDEQGIKINQQALSQTLNLDQQAQ